MMLKFFGIKNCVPTGFSTGRYMYNITEQLFAKHCLIYCQALHMPDRGSRCKFFVVRPIMPFFFPYSFIQSSGTLLNCMVFEASKARNPISKNLIRILHTFNAFRLQYFLYKGHIWLKYGNEGNGTSVSRLMFDMSFYCIYFVRKITFCRKLVLIPL